ncbi:MAG TPA: hypothetical protein VFG14_01480 [Chthoniobacteraceae bacterium]|nr:hypothetical protein [Chthoniobacteraceae bacterium]
MTDRISKGSKSIASPFSDSRILSPARGTIGWTTVAILWAAVPVSAHPGHDLLENGVSHVATSPFHLLVLASAGLVLAVLARYVRRPSTRVYLRLGAALCLVTAAAITLLR